MGFLSKLLGRNIRTIDAATLTTSYQNVGAVTTITGWKISIVNASNTDVQVSDGSSWDAWYVPANSTISIGEGLSSFAAQLDRQGQTKKGCQFQAKLPSGAAGTGILVITVEGN